MIIDVRSALLYLYYLDLHYGLLIDNSFELLSLVDIKVTNKLWRIIFYNLVTITQCETYLSEFDSCHIFPHFSKEWQKNFPNIYDIFQSNT